MWILSPTCRTTFFLFPLNLCTRGPFWIAPYSVSLIFCCYVSWLPKFLRTKLFKIFNFKSRLLRKSQIIALRDIFIIVIYLGKQVTLLRIFWSLFPIVQEWLIARVTISLDSPGFLWDLSCSETDAKCPGFWLSSKFVWNLILKKNSKEIN